MEKLVLAMMNPLPQYYAKELHDAISCVGTEETVLIEILCTMSNHEIRVIKEAYYASEYYKPSFKNIEKRQIIHWNFTFAVFNASLEDDLSSDTSGSFQRLMVSLCCGGRDESFDVNLEAARHDARELLQAGQYHNEITVS